MVSSVPSNIRRCLWRDSLSSVVDIGVRSYMWKAVSSLCWAGLFFSCVGKQVALKRDS